LSEYIVDSDLGNTSLQAVSLAGIEDAYSKHSEEAESKGVKAHFRMDDSGILHLDKVENFLSYLLSMIYLQFSLILNARSEFILDCRGGGGCVLRLGN